MSILRERGELSFSDPLSQHLDAEFMDGLHVLRGIEHSGEIRIRHLLNQTSGLYDSFWPLLQKLAENPSMRITPREAVEWAKRNLSPKSKPGEKHHYTYTNYYLLGLIVERITGERFHDALHRLVFEPLGMQSAYMQGFSEPAVRSKHPPAQIFINGVDYSDTPGFAEIDYAGGGVRATLDDFLKFMTALVNHRVVRDWTLQRLTLQIQSAAVHAIAGDQTALEVSGDRPQGRAGSGTQLISGCCPGVQQPGLCPDPGPPPEAGELCTGFRGELMADRFNLVQQRFRLLQRVPGFLLRDGVEITVINISAPRLKQLDILHGLNR